MGRSPQSAIAAIAAACERSAPVTAPSASSPGPSWGPFALGDGPDACLLLHGLTGSPAEVRPLGEALAAAGLRAVGPLLPGHGVAPEALFDVGRGDLYDAAHQALRELSGARRVFVAGLSAGALLAIELCARERLRGGDPDIAAVALLSPAVRFRGNAWLLSAVAGRLPALRLPILVPKGPRDLPGPEPEDSRSPGLRSDGSQGSVPLGWGRELRLLSEEALALARRVHAPALVCHGSLDRTAALPGARKLAAALGSRAVELRVFARSGHLILLGEEGPEVSAAVVDFFARKRPGLG